MPNPVKIETISLSFLGTNQHRESINHVITSYHRAIKGSDDRIATRLFDGPGSSPAHPDSRNPTPGTYIYDPLTQSKIPASNAVLRAIDSSILTLTGQLAGEGVDNLLLEASLYIQKIIDDNEGVLPKRINLQGFSRGADACVRMANVLNQLHPDIEVNLFLIDQVPGPGRRDDPHSYTIPGNVKQFESVMMLHEYRPGFDAQHPGRYVFSEPEKTHVSFRLHYGNHWAATLQTNDPNTNQVSKLVHDDLYKFHIQAQTLAADAPVPIPYSYEKKDGISGYIPRPAPEPLTDLDRFRLYCDIKDNEWIYGRGRRLSTRILLSQQESFIRDSGLFVNQEHRELFKEYYPAAFNWFFEQNSAANQEEAVQAELQSLSQIHPDFHSRLAHYVAYDLSTLPPPRGAPRREVAAIGKPLIQDELSHLRHSLVAMANYYHYHSPVKSPVCDQIRTDILNTAQQNERLSDAESLAAWQSLIERSRNALNNQQDKGFMWQQINQISPDVAAYAAEIKTLLEAHRLHNLLMSPAQKQVLRAWDERIDQINANPELSNHEKYAQMKNELQQVNVVIDHLDNTTEDTVEDVFRKAYFTPILDDQSGHTPASFSYALNKLSHPTMGGRSFSEQLSKDLTAYSKRNNFWKSVRDIFHAIKLPFRLPFSEDKDRIATELQDNLAELDAQGHGNSPSHLRPLLNEAADKLRVLYASSDSNRIQTGRLDRIIRKAEGRINYHQPLAQVPVQEDQDNIRPGPH